MNLEITDKITEEDKETIYQGLLSYNLARIEDKNPRDLGVYLQDEAGEMAGGADWKYTRKLAVCEIFMGQGRYAGPDYWQ